MLGVLTALAALGVHGLSLYHPLLYFDDFDILLKSLTWGDACANLWVPVNEHTCPLTRLSNWLLIQAAGRLTALPLAAALQVRLMLLAGLGLMYLFVRREIGHPFHGLVAMTLFGVSAVYQGAVIWFAASQALGALDMTLLALLAAQRWRQTGRGWHLVLSALWAALAPAWFAIGILAGFLASVYLLCPLPPNVRRNGWAGLVPLLGSLAFLGVSLPLSGEQILHADHYGSQTALQAFNIPTGIVSTARSLVDNLVLGSVGIAGVTCPPAVAAAGLVVLIGAGVWWWRRAPTRRLVILGLAFILASDLLIYSARAAWSYSQVSSWSRYNLFPQLGMALIVCGGLRRGLDRETPPNQPARLSRKQLGRIGWLLLVLFVLQLPHGIIGSPEYEPRQREVFQMVEDMDARCRAYHISAATARRVLDKVVMPGGSDGDNAWYFLRGSDDPRPLSDEEARRLLLP
jgi:hypothetical protein